MIIQHLLLFVFLAFLLGRKPKPNYRTRSRTYDAAYRRPAERTLASDTTYIHNPANMPFLQVNR